MKTILFYWSRGADTRVKLLKLIERTEKAGGGAVAQEELAAAATTSRAVATGRGTGIRGRGGR